MKLLESASALLMIGGLFIVIFIMIAPHVRTADALPCAGAIFLFVIVGIGYSAHEDQKQQKEAERKAEAEEAKRKKELDGEYEETVYDNFFPH